MAKPAWTLSRRRLLVASAGLVASWSVRPVRALPAALGRVVDPVSLTLQRYVSTLVPGPDEDPTGSPGAVEAGAVDQLREQVPYLVPLLVADLDAAALATFRRPFASLGYARRERLLVTAFTQPSRRALHLAAMAVGAGTFYGDFRNRVGGAHIGFPGPSDGYLASWTDRTGHGQPQRDAIPA
jgi:hypothetical protein